MDVDEEKSPFVKAIIQDCVGNFHRYRYLFEELCFTPIEGYLSERVVRYTNIFFIGASFMILLNIIIMMMIVDLRKHVRRM